MSIFHSLEHATHLPWFLWSALFSSALLLSAGWLVRSRLAAAHGGLIPDEGLSLRNVIELVVQALAKLAQDNMGPNWRRYFPFIGTIFMFILISNWLGMFPLFEGATSHANTTYAWAIISFVLHQYVGIREHGFGYIKHFLGPSLYDLKIGGRTIHLRLLAPIFLLVETLSHLSRIFTLAVRLLASMFADHTVVAVWLMLVPMVVPAAFLGLGFFIGLLQAFVFSMLSMIYIGLALEEAH